MMVLKPRSLWRDDVGDTIIQFVLVLPVFLLLIFGSYEIWKVVHLKQGLEAATIQATRYLSIEGRFLLDEYNDSWRDAWQGYARGIIASELLNEPFLQDHGDVRLDVFVAEPEGRRPNCPTSNAVEAATAQREAERARFAVTSRLEVPFPVRIPFFSNPEVLRLEETHRHYLECRPMHVDPTPTPTTEP